MYLTGGTWTITTNTRQYLGLGTRTYNESTWKRYRFTLQQGIDYNATSLGNITVLVYNGATLYSNFTITYLQPANDVAHPTSFFETAQRPKYLVIFYILLIIISMAIGTYWKETDHGFHAFMIGGILLTIFLTEFWLLALVNCLYYALRTSHEVIKE